MQLSRRSCSQLKFDGSHARVMWMLITCARDVNHMHRKQAYVLFLHLSLRIWVRYSNFGVPAELGSAAENSLEVWVAVLKIPLIQPALSEFGWVTLPSSCLDSGLLTPFWTSSGRMH
jgi:hypothetical protein